MFYNGFELSADNVKEMRNWLQDCQWQDVEAEDIDEMPDSIIVRAVQSHYDGGIKQFLSDGVIVNP